MGYDGAGNGKIFIRMPDILPDALLHKELWQKGEL